MCAMKEQPAGERHVRRPFWEGKGFSFFCNRACEYYPCHPIEEGEELNCLFCYCPLYLLGDACGGDFTYLGNGIKDCSRCLLPHRRERYGEITQRFQELKTAMEALDGTRRARGRET